jgi:hypothetical protein
VGINDRRSYRAALLALGALCVLAYFRALWLPIIADTYLQIELGRRWGPIEAWPDLAKDALYRCRATSIVLTWWIERLFGVEAPVLRTANLSLHILATWLVFAFGAVKQIGWKLSFLAAAFFAVYEGHQEAVMWFAAIPEVLVFIFVLASILCWLLWLQSEGARKAMLAASLLFFVLALLSKESGVVVPALMGASLLIYRAQWRRIILAVAPCVVLNLVYAVLIFEAQSNHLHFNDGTFSTKANVAFTMINSIGRLFWFWGLLSLVALIALKRRDQLLTIAGAGVWIVITFLPYSFIAYMPRVPSRHTYLASAGLAIIVAAAYLALRERHRHTHSWIPAAVAVAVILHNTGYIWIKKQEQYLVRAAPTEELIRLGRSHKGPILLRCFPYGPELAAMVLRQETGRPESDLIVEASNRPNNVAEFCYDRGF